MSKLFNKEISYSFDQWEIPKNNLLYWKGKSRKYCLVIPVINEGEKIKVLIFNPEINKCYNRCKIRS